MQYNFFMCILQQHQKGKLVKLDSFIGDFVKSQSHCESIGTFLEKNVQLCPPRSGKNFLFYLFEAKSCFL